MSLPVALILQRLVHARVPQCVLWLCFLLLRSSGHGLAQTLSHVELFSGMQAITSYFIGKGFAAAPFDVINDAMYENMNTTQGFIAALMLVLQILDGGGLWAAPVCSSWSWVNRLE